MFCRLLRDLIVIECVYLLVGLCPVWANERDSSSDAARMKEVNLVGLNLNEAFSRTLNDSIQLNLSLLDVEAREAEIVQVDRLPNPILSYEQDGIRKNGEKRGVVTQLIELGGKRNFRKEIAANQYYAALVNYEASKMELLNRLCRAFINAAFAQEYLELAYAEKDLSEEILRAVSEKVNVGKLSDLHVNKARLVSAKADLILQKAKVDFDTARERLAYFWGSNQPDFERVNFDFYDIESPAPLNEYLDQLCNKPELVKAQFEYLTAQQQLNLEKAGRIPDVALSLGYQSVGDKDERGVVMAVSVPLPVFDQNQGNIRRAYAEMHKSSEQGRLIWLILESKLSASYKSLVRIYQEAEKIKNSLLESAYLAFKQADEGFREGKFEYLEVLDAQNTLFEIKEKYIEALADYHLKRADVDYLHSQIE